MGLSEDKNYERMTEIRETTFLSVAIALSIVLLATGGYIGWHLRDDEADLEAWGSYISGLASALAFIWLVVGLYAQRQELQYQRIELKLQRKALRDTASVSQINLLMQISEDQLRSARRNVRQIIKTLNDKRVKERISSIEANYIGNSNAYLEALHDDQSIRNTVAIAVRKDDMITRVQ
ncbi:MAG: hypothetical protein AAFZ01_14100, partial [Pseudomonadota bacterium]